MTEAFKYLLIGYLTIVPCFFIHGLEMRPTQELIFRLGAMVLIMTGLCMPLKTKMRKINFWIAAFGLWSIFLYRYARFWIGTGYLFNICLGIMLYFVCSYALRKRDAFTIIRCILLVCVINYIYVLSQRYFHFDPLFYVRGNNGENYGVFMPIGFFGLPANMGQYFALAMPLLAFLHPLMPVLCLFPLYLSTSTMAVGGGCAGLLFYLWMSKVQLKIKRFKLLWFWLYFMVFTVCVPIYILKVDNPMGHQLTRISMWGQGLKHALHRPVTGWGLDSWRDTFEGKPYLFCRINGNTNIVMTVEEIKKFRQENPTANLDIWDDAHNEYLQLFFEFGIVGVLLIIMIARQLIRRLKTGGAAAYAFAGSIICFFIMSIGQFPLHIARIGHIFPIILGAYVAYTSN